MTVPFERTHFKSWQLANVPNQDPIILDLSLQPRNSQSRLKTYVPGDTMRGSVEAHVIGPLELVDVKAQLEGVTRFWIPSHKSRKGVKWYEHKFFKQECSILRSFHRSVGWGIMHTATSFECYIANHLPVEGREAQNRALARLPPSVAQGEARFDKTGKLYMQPLIEFSVSVSVSYRGVSGTETIKNIELHCPITMASSMDFEPPLYQALTCEQQSNTCHTWLRKNRLAPKFAEVEVGLSMHGTEPLRSSPGCSIQHTKRYLQVSWAPKHTSTPQTETTVTLHVESILVSKTCYGALLSDDFPNAQQLRCEAVKLRSKIIKLGTRKCQFVIPQSANTTISPANPYYALLLLPIQSSIVVPPSFATAHATRDYTLRVTVSFKGFCQGALALEAGLQVNQCFETKQPPERVISALRLTETNMEENTEPVPPYAS